MSALYLLDLPGAQCMIGEDALANLSVERTESGTITGHVRIRSKTQGIALSLGDRITMGGHLSPATLASHLLTVVCSAKRQHAACIDSLYRVLIVYIGSGSVNLVRDRPKWQVATWTYFDCKNSLSKRPSIH